MASVAQAVLQFDEAVRVPWRPPLAAVPRLTVVQTGEPALRHRAHASRAARLEVLPPSGRAATAPDGRRPAARAPRPAGAVRAGCARCGTPGACPREPLRLTRRARRLLVLLASACAVAAVTGLGALTQADDGLRLAGDSSTVVRAGDTLWSIARSTAGGEDVRAVVDQIQRLNGLEGTALAPGQVLRLP